CHLLWTFAHRIIAFFQYHGSLPDLCGYATIFNPFPGSYPYFWAESDQWKLRPSFAYPFGQLFYYRLPINGFSTSCQISLSYFGPTNVQKTYPQGVDLWIRQ